MNEKKSLWFSRSTATFLWSQFPDALKKQRSVEMKRISIVHIFQFRCLINFFPCHFYGVTKHDKNVRGGWDEANT